MKDMTYAETVRWRMKSGETPSRARYTIRELAGLTGYTYEHIRKIVSGAPVVSEELNEQLAEILGFDGKELWRQAMREKLQHRYPDIPTVDLLPGDRRMADLWVQLTAEQREKLVTIAAGWAAENSMRPATERRQLTASR
jgi:transcriptional regulator with XRE-family HTH domain